MSTCIHVFMVLVVMSRHCYESSVFKFNHQLTQYASYNRATGSFAESRWDNMA